MRAATRVDRRAQGRHYERAFEAYLRAHRLPYVAVDEARRALVPGATGAAAGEGGQGGEDLKSFDFAVYPAGGPNLLVDIKGRRVRGGGAGVGGSGGVGGLQTWVTEDDVRSLRAWEALFCAGGTGGAGGVGGGAGVGGAGGFRGVFVFVYWLDEQPADGAFREVFEHRRRWYGLRAVGVGEYAGAMRPRSARWGTVSLAARDFERLSGPEHEVVLWGGGRAG